MSIANGKDAALQRARDASRAGDNERAASIYERLLEEYSEDPQVLFDYTRAKIRRVCRPEWCERLAEPLHGRDVESSAGKSPFRLLVTGTSPTLMLLPAPGSSSASRRPEKSSGRLHSGALNGWVPADIT